jgi:hypothetical protein
MYMFFVTEKPSGSFNKVSVKNNKNFSIRLLVNTESNC